MTKAGQGENAPVKAEPRRRLRVLCADDDKHIGDMLKHVPQSAGHYVELAEDGQSALQHITDGKLFDVLVTDHEMPVLTGLRLVERLRALGFPGKIIVHCSELRPKEAAAFNALAVDHIIRKPVRLDDFLSVIQRLGNVAP